MLTIPNNETTPQVKGKLRIRTTKREITKFKRISPCRLDEITLLKTTKKVSRGGGYALKTVVEVDEISRISTYEDDVVRICKHSSNHKAEAFFKLGPESFHVVGRFDLNELKESFRTSAKDVSLPVRMRCDLRDWVRNFDERPWDFRDYPSFLRANRLCHHFCLMIRKSFKEVFTMEYSLFNRSNSLCRVMHELMGSVRAMVHSRLKDSR